MPGERARQQGPAKVVWYGPHGTYHVERYTDGRTPTRDACDRARALRARGAAAVVRTCRIGADGKSETDIGFVDVEYLGAVRDGDLSPRSSMPTADVVGSDDLESGRRRR